MPGKRELAARVLASFGITRAAGAARSRLVRDLRVLAYHRVLPHLDEATYPFDLELVSALEAEFDWQMAYVARHFVPVTCAQVAATLAGGPLLPRRAVMVTFDDGFRDNHDVALPVLRRRGVPAVFFVSTGYVGTHAVFWFDRIVHLLLRTSLRTLRLEAIDVDVHLGDGTPAARRAAAANVLSRLKRVDDVVRLRVLEELDTQAGVALDDATRAASEPMTWDHVRALNAAGMEIGSHTVSHPILARTAPATMRAELEQSKADIERETGQAPLALAYPVGGVSAVDDAVIAATSAAGYQIAFTYRSGVNPLPIAAPLLLKRLHVERYTTRPMFEAALQLPSVFA